MQKTNSFFSFLGYRNIQTNQINENKLIDTSGNSELDEFIKETQNDSKYCDFIEWIPNNYLENVKYLTKGGNSNIFLWNLEFNHTFGYKSY